MKYIEKNKLKYESYSDEFAKLIANSEYLYTLCNEVVWAEGPVFLDENVIFSDVKSNKMYCYSPTEGKTVFREFSNYANGNYLDAQKRLVTCEHGRRCISRTEKDGTVSILVDKYEGKRFNSPNDVVVKSDGSIWFTDPPYGILNDVEGYKSESQIIGCYVYRFDPKSNDVVAVITDTQRPNGLAFSPNEDILYVADMSVVEFPINGRRHIREYKIENNEVVSAGKNIAEIAPGIPDGFRVDKKGRLYVSYEHGIKVLRNTGECIGNILVPERVSNCTFGNDMLYITATSSLYSVKLEI